LARTALYARVSTEEQKEGQTIDSQIAELERFSRERDWEITGIYKDEGWSGSVLARPELDRLRDDASKGLFKVALINDVDRLARDVTHLGIVKRDLERRGVQVVFRKLPTEQSPTHNLMVNILGSFAEFERELILDRTRRGRRHKVEVRKQFIGSLAPYGFRYIPKDKSANKEGVLELVPEEATIVRQMFDWVDKLGLSARDVIRRLSIMKVLPRKKGNQWGKSSVLRILRSETYAGVWHYNKYEGCEPVNAAKNGKYRKSLKGSIRLRPRSEWLPLELPNELQLIERDQWQRVQQQITRNITFADRNSKHEYLLKGLVRCGGCGARYVGDPCHGVYYYRCLARCKKLRTIREDRLDGPVWSAIEEAILNPELIAEQIEKLQARRVADAGRFKSEDAEIEGAFGELQSEESRVLEVYRKGIITPEHLRTELEQLNARRTALETRRAAVSQSAIETPTNVKRSVFDWCRFVAGRLNELSKQQRQQFLRLLVNEILFEGNQVRIRCVIPMLNVKQNTVAPERLLREEGALETSSRTANVALHSRGRNSIADSGIATMESRLHGRNSASEVGFELAKFLPEAVPLKDKLTPEFLRRLLQHHPRATLAEYRDELKIEYSIVASTTALCRAFKQAGLDSHVRSQIKIDSKAV